MSQPPPEPAVRYHRLPPVDTHPITATEIRQLKQPDGGSLATVVGTFSLGAAVSGLYSLLGMQLPDPLTVRVFVLIALTVGFGMIGGVALIVILVLPNRKKRLLEEITKRLMPMPGQGPGQQQSSTAIVRQDEE